MTEEKINEIIDRCCAKFDIYVDKQIRDIAFNRVQNILTPKDTEEDIEGFLMEVISHLVYEVKRVQEEKKERERRNKNDENKQQRSDDYER